MPQAQQAWRAVFAEAPSLEVYKTLKRLAAASWEALRPELMAILRKSYDTQVLAEVLLFDEEWDEAMRLAEQPHTWYGVVEMVADAVATHRPDWVVQVSIAHAERLIAETKSKYYPIAAAWLDRVKHAYALLGQTEVWRVYLQRLKEQYKRRPALQEQLRRLERG